MLASLRGGETHPISSDKATCRGGEEANDQVLNLRLRWMRSPTTPLHQKRHIKFTSFAHLSRPLSRRRRRPRARRCRAPPAPPRSSCWSGSQRTGRAPRPWRCGWVRRESCVLPSRWQHPPPKITETTGLVQQSGSGVGSFIGTENTLRLSRLRRVYFQHTASPQTLGFNSSWQQGGHRTHTHTHTRTTPLTFLGLGRTAPEEVHTALRLGVTVLPGTDTLPRGEQRAFVTADSLTKRPRAGAMLTATWRTNSNAGKRYVNCGYGD